jgi:polyisoprenoid-binding protein YceI
MKRILPCLLAAGVTALVAYYFTARHYAARHAEQLALERERWESGRARLELPPNSNVARLPRETDRPGSPVDPAPQPQLQAPKSVPANPLRPSLPEQRASGKAPATTSEAAGPLVTSSPAPDAPAAWIRYEQTLPGQGSKCRIDGTSSIHPWSMETPIIAGSFEVDARARFDAPPGAADLGTNVSVPARAQVRIPVRTLKSYAAKMDQVYKEHMEETTYRNIEFQLTQLDWVSPEAAAVTHAPLAARGALAIHGVTNVVTLPTAIQPVDADKLRISGQATLKMTSFGVKPPAPVIAGMPAIETGDDIVVMFEWVVKRVSP